MSTSTDQTRPASGGARVMRPLNNLVERFTTGVVFIVALLLLGPGA